MVEMSDELELDCVEVERLLGLVSRNYVKGRLLLLLKELQEEKQRQEALSSLSTLQLAGTLQSLPKQQHLPATTSPAMSPPPPPSLPLQNGYGQYMPQQQKFASLASTAKLLAYMNGEGRNLPYPAHVGPGAPLPPGSNGPDASAAALYDGTWSNGHGQAAAYPPHINQGVNRNTANGAPWNNGAAMAGNGAAGMGQFRPGAPNNMNGLDYGQGATGMSAVSATAITPYAAPAHCAPMMLGNYLGGPPPQLAPFGFGASLLGNGDFTFRTLTTCSWEQSETMVKVYVPLRGAQTELLRSNFTMNSVEIKVYNLQGKNYVFTIMPTCKHILGEACVAVASKTKKNILITIQKLSSATPEERHWHDLFGTPPGASPDGLALPAM